MAIWHIAPLRFAPAFRALGVCDHSWLGEIEKFIIFTFERTSFRFDPVSQSGCSKLYSAKYFSAKWNLLVFRPSGSDTDWDFYRFSSGRFLEFDRSKCIRIFWLTAQFRLISFRDSLLLIALPILPIFILRVLFLLVTEYATNAFFSLNSVEGTSFFERFSFCSLF